MGLFMYSAVNGKHASTQAYLGSVRTCPECGGQQPKETFRMVDGVSICQECQEEKQLEAKESQ